MYVLRSLLKSETGYSHHGILVEYQMTTKKLKQNSYIFQPNIDMGIFLNPEALNKIIKKTLGIHYYGKHIW